MEKALEKLEKLLKNLDNNTIIGLHNRYCEINSYYEDYIEDMSSFNEMFCDYKPLELVKSIGDNFSPYDDFYRKGVLEIESFSKYENSPVTFYKEIAEYCLDNDDDFDNKQIRDLLDEYKEELNN